MSEEDYIAVTNVIEKSRENKFQKESVPKKSTKDLMEKKCPDQKNNEKVN